MSEETLATTYKLFINDEIVPINQMRDVDDIVSNLHRSTNFLEGLYSLKEVCYSTSGNYLYTTDKEIARKFSFKQFNPKTQKYELIPQENHPIDKETTNFERELIYLINKHCIDSSANIPDYILAGFLTECLNAFKTAPRHRKWNDDQ